VPVERHGQPPPRELPEKQPEKRGKRGRRRSSADRASGPRRSHPKGPPLMRVSAAACRGRHARRPKRQRSPRPPTGCAKRCSTSWCMPYDNPFVGARVLDLFAGTGALGIEALSRGAAFTLFVDDGAERAALLREMLRRSASGTSRIFRRDATKLGPAHPVEPFALAFLDPPYGKGRAEQALASARAGGWLLPDALIVVEEAKKIRVRGAGGFCRDRTPWLRRYRVCRA